MPQTKFTDDDELEGHFFIFVHGEVEATLSELEIYYGQNLAYEAKEVALDQGENILWDAYIDDQPVNAGLYHYMITLRNDEKSCEVSYSGDLNVEH